MLCDAAVMSVLFMTPMQPFRQIGQAPLLSTGTLASSAEHLRRCDASRSVLTNNEQLSPGILCLLWTWLPGKFHVAH